MKNLSTYLFVMFMIMFWVFRIIVAFCDNMGIEFITAPYDFNFEIILLFLTFISMILVIKRSIFGAIIYAIGYWLYFGVTIFNLIPVITDAPVMQNYIDLVFSAIGIVLPFLILSDLLLDRNRKEHPKDKKTDWFYKNKDYDRKFDERADRNEYKF